MEDRIADRFAIETEAGRGGMGVVYRARDAATNQTVALKILASDSAPDVVRFTREAEVLAELTHPHVVRYIDHGVASNGKFFLAMEWLEGETLADCIAHRKLSPAEAARVVQDAARGLGAAHARGIVHRDVKPANLFLADGRVDCVKVIDFGIARVSGRGHTLTTAGTVVGTPFYMAPEQASANTALDPRADVYSLGAVLYELLAGRPPFSSDSLMAVLAAILLDPPIDVRERAPGTPRDLAMLTMRLLAKRPDERPTDGTELANAIDGLAERLPSEIPLSTDAPSLTGAELRVLCLVLGSAPLAAIDARTLHANERDPLGSMHAAVEAHGGRLEVLADGSFVARMAELGTPAEQAVRAARSAIALRAIAADLPLAVVAGRGMWQGPIPVGEVIERGSRLVRLGIEGAGATRVHGAFGGAPPDRRPAPIRLDDVSAGLLEGRFVIDRDGSVASLGAERADPSTVRTLLGRSTPCVGRKRELASLHALIEEAISEPIARAAVVLGPAGRGKSRLVAEACDRLRRLDDPPELWLARADPLGAGSPFTLIGQLLRSAASITDGEPLAVRRAKLIALFGRSLASGRVDSVGALLGPLARTPFATDDAATKDDPKLRGDAIRDAFLTWFGAHVARRPTVIVIDDLQWGDRPSLAFLSAALKGFATFPLVLLAVGRSEASALFDELFEEDRDPFVLRLSRLTPKASAELVQSALGDAIDDGAVARLVDRADGNPFFLEELVRAISEGRGEADLPATVLGIVEERLASLPAETRRVLRAASVFGRRFWRGGVLELLGGTTDVDGHLAMAVQRELVDAAERPRFEREQELVFRHALTREAAHAMLTEADRSLGHRLAGEWLERAGEPDALTLAEHFQRGGADARAAVWWGRAAEQALEGDDLAAAIERAERALATADHDHGPVLVTLADAHRWRGEYAAASSRAMQAAQTVLPGTRGWFRALGVIFAASGRIGRADDAEPFRHAAMECTAEAGAVGAQVVVLCRAATLPLAAGDRTRFEATLGRAEALAREHAADDPLARAWILTLRASWALRDGDHGAFVDRTEEAVAAYERAGDARDACNQKVRLGNGYVGLGDPERAERVLREALAAARRMGLPLIEGYALQNLGHALLRRGDATGSLEAQAAAIAIAQELGDAVLEAGARLYRAEAHEQARDAMRALEDAGRAVELLADRPAFLAVARAVRARVKLGSGDAHGALAEAEEAARAGADAPMEEGEALVTLVHAQTLAALGRDDEARDVATEAARRLRSRAERIEDRGWRDAFLHRVPTHARILEMAR